MEGAIHSIKYPVFAINWILNEDKEYSIVIAGGGGSSKSGIQNRVTFGQEAMSQIANSTKQGIVINESLILDTGDELVTNMAIHPKGKLLACGVNDTTILYDIGQDEIKEKVQLKTDFEEERAFQNALAFNYNGTHLATGGEDGHLRIWKVASLKKDAKDIKPQHVLKGHQMYINALDYHPEVNMLVSTSKDGQCIIWDCGVGKLVKKLPSAGTTILPSKDNAIPSKYIYRSCRFVPHMPQVLLTLQTPPRGASYLSKWDIKDKEFTLVKTICLGKMSACTLAARAPYVALGGSDGSVTVYDIATMNQVRKVYAHHLPVTGIAFKPVANTEDSEIQLISASADYSLYLLHGNGSGILRSYVFILSLLVVFFAIIYQFSS